MKNFSGNAHQRRIEARADRRRGRFTELLTGKQDRREEVALPPPEPIERPRSELRVLRDFLHRRKP